LGYEVAEGISLRRQKLKSLDVNADFISLTTTRDCSHRISKHLRLAPRRKLLPLLLVT
jgi:hypothetical protein